MNRILCQGWTRRTHATDMLPQCSAKDVRLESMHSETNRRLEMSRPKRCAVMTKHPSRPCLQGSTTVWLEWRRFVCERPCIECSLRTQLCAAAIVHCPADFLS